MIGFIQEMVQCWIFVMSPLYEFSWRASLNASLLILHEINLSLHYLAFFQKSREEVRK
jgi:hypothetical protein